jgi:hypothetical protein
MDIVGDINNRSIGHLYRHILERHTLYPILNLSINRESMIIGVASWVITRLIGRRQSDRHYLPPLKGKERAIHSMPHFEDGYHWRINDLWSCLFSNMSDAWSQWSIHKELAAYIGWYSRDIPVTASMPVTTFFINQATAKCSRGLKHTNPE